MTAPVLWLEASAIMAGPIQLYSARHQASCPARLTPLPSPRAHRTLRVTPWLRSWSGLLPRPYPGAAASRWEVVALTYLEVLLWMGAVIYTLPAVWTMATVSSW